MKLWTENKSDIATSGVDPDEAMKFVPKGTCFVYTDRTFTVMSGPDADGIQQVDITTNGETVATYREGSVLSYLYDRASEILL